MNLCLYTDFLTWQFYCRGRFSQLKILLPWQGCGCLVTQFPPIFFHYMYRRLPVTKRVLSPDSCKALRICGVCNWITSRKNTELQSRLCLCVKGVTMQPQSVMLYSIGWKSHELMAGAKPQLSMKMVCCFTDLTIKSWQFAFWNILRAISFLWDLCLNFSKHRRWICSIELNLSWVYVPVNYTIIWHMQACTWLLNHPFFEFRLWYI